MSFVKKMLLTTLIFYCFSFSICYCTEIDYSDNYAFSSIDVDAAISSVPQINSRSAIVLERSTGTILFGKNENDIKKMASTTKIMTAIVVLENCDDFGQIVTISKKSAGIGGSRLGLSTNSKITVLDLLYGLLLCSGNDAAIALAEFIGESVEGFSNLMNQKALDLGLENTHFVTPHGLDNEDHYTTAYELAILTQYALENDTFSNIVNTKNHTVYINGSPKNISNTNELLGNLSGVYGVKTGFTNGANRCLVTACKRDNLDIICVVLGADSKKFRTQDSIKLIEYAFSNFEMLDIKSIIEKNFLEWQSESLDSFIVNKGINNNIETYLEDVPYNLYPVNKSKLKDIHVKIDCCYNFEAPLPQNICLGKLNCYAGDTLICTLKILSSNYISKKNPLFYLNSFFKNYSTHLGNLFNF